MSTKTKIDPNLRLTSFKIVSDLFTSTHTAFNFNAMYEVAEDLLAWAYGKPAPVPVQKTPDYKGENVTTPEEPIKVAPKKAPAKKLKF